MGDLPWLDGYSGQTTADLLSLEGRYRIDSIVSAFDQGTKQAARIGIVRITSAERIAFGVEAVDREVTAGDTSASSRGRPSMQVGLSVGLG
jgi:hypothetical protein